MPQKYALYLNRKAILFNNSQGVHPQVDKDLIFHGSSQNSLIEALDALESALNEELRIYLPDFSFAKALPLLKTRYHFLQAAGGIVIAPLNQALFIYRLDTWDLPKGKVEKDEAIDTAAAREITEETGISVLANQKFLCHTYHMYPHKGKTVLKETTWYTFETPEASRLIPQTEEDITEAVWKNLDDLSDVLQNTYPSIEDVLTCLNQ
jgi:8-oxo-dGTP pyrophosphatase MutT (NUDIX family)